MRRITLYTAGIGLLLLAFSCEERTVNPLISEELLNTWLLYERGYSPGAAYITEP